MTQKIFELFGISLNIDPYVKESEYKEVHDQLVLHLKTLPNIDLKNVEVYINQLEIHTEPSRFGIAPLQARLSHIDVSIETFQSAKSLIWFLNKDLPLKMNPEIEVKARAHKISYSLSSDYCDTHDRYIDYIATAVMSNCPQKYRRLTITGIAQATQSFKEKLLNFTGTTKTKIQFPLTGKCQLPLSFGGESRFTHRI
jgi:hypothetical protein